MWFFPITNRHRPNTVAPKPSEGSSSSRCGWPGTVERMGLPDGCVQRCYRGDKTAVDGLLKPTRRYPSRSTISCWVHPDHAACVRHREPLRASACRRSAAPVNHAIALPDADLDEDRWQRWRERQVSARPVGVALAISACVAEARRDRRHPGRPDRRARRHQSKTTASTGDAGMGRWRGCIATRWPPMSTPPKPTAPPSFSTAAVSWSAAA